MYNFGIFSYFLEVIHGCFSTRMLRDIFVPPTLKMEANITERNETIGREKFVWGHTVVCIHEMETDTNSHNTLIKTHG
jgi:hypothetical protein